MRPCACSAATWVTIAIPISYTWTSAQIKQIAILGGAFGGLYAAICPDRTVARDQRVEVELIDPQDFAVSFPRAPSFIQILGRSVIAPRPGSWQGLERKYFESGQFCRHRCLLRHRLLRQPRRSGIARALEYVQVEAVRS
jgi:hypothetical protein